MTTPETPPRPARHLGVSYALDGNGRVANPLTAPRGAPYRCFGCEEPVVLRRGTINEPHFSHHRGSSCSATGESIEHAAFKRLLRDGLRRHRRYTVQATCPACAHRQVTTHRLDETAEVHEEVPIDGYRADVGVLVGERVVLAVEVYVTHEVGARKAAALQVPWLEVAANPAGVLDPEKVPSLRVLDSNLFLHRPCRGCGKTSESRAERDHVRKLAKEQYWQQVAEMRAEQARKEAQFRAEIDARPVRPVPEMPPSWLTLRTPSYGVYRSPLSMNVRGVGLLVHPALLPEGTVQVCQTARGCYVFKHYALRFIGSDGHESYASGALAGLLEELLDGRETVHPEATAMLEEVRMLVGEGRPARFFPAPTGPAKPVVPRTASVPAPQPGLWD